MKRLLSLITIISLVLSNAALVQAAPADNIKKAKKTITKISRVTPKKKKVSMTKGSSRTFKVKLSPGKLSGSAKKSIVVKSTDKSVASISAKKIKTKKNITYVTFKVKAKKVGSTTIYVKSKKKSAKWALTVKKKTSSPGSSITLSHNAQSMLNDDENEYIYNNQLHVTLSGWKTSGTISVGTLDNPTAVILTSDNSNINVENGVATYTKSLAKAATVTKDIYLSYQSGTLVADTEYYAFFTPNDTKTYSSKKSSAYTTDSSVSTTIIAEPMSDTSVSAGAALSLGSYEVFDQYESSMDATATQATITAVRFEGASVHVSNTTVVENADASSGAVSVTCKKAYTFQSGDYISYRVLEGRTYFTVTQQYTNGAWKISYADIVASPAQIIFATSLSGLTSGTADKGTLSGKNTNLLDITSISVSEGIVTIDNNGTFYYIATIDTYGALLTDAIYNIGTGKSGASDIAASTSEGVYDDELVAGRQIFISSAESDTSYTTINGYGFYVTTQSRILTSVGEASGGVSITESNSYKSVTVTGYNVYDQFGDLYNAAATLTSGALASDYQANTPSSIGYGASATFTSTVSSSGALSIVFTLTDGIDYMDSLTAVIGNAQYGFTGKNLKITAGRSGALGTTHADWSCELTDTISPGSVAISSLAISTTGTSYDAVVKLSAFLASGTFTIGTINNPIALSINSATYTSGSAASAVTNTLNVSNLHTISWENDAIGTSQNVDINVNIAKSGYAAGETYYVYFTPSFPSANLYTNITSAGYKTASEAIINTISTTTGTVTLNGILNDGIITLGTKNDADCVMITSVAISSSSDANANAKAVCVTADNESQYDAGRGTIIWTQDEGEPVDVKLTLGWAKGSVQSSTEYYLYYTPASSDYSSLTSPVYKTNDDTAQTQTWTVGSGTAFTVAEQGSHQFATLQITDAYSSQIIATSSSITIAKAKFYDASANAFYEGSLDGTITLNSSIGAISSNIADINISNNASYSAAAGDMIVIKVTANNITKYLIRKYSGSGWQDAYVADASLFGAATLTAASSLTLNSGWYDQSQTAYVGTAVTDGTLLVSNTSEDSGLDIDVTSTGAITISGTLLVSAVGSYTTLVYTNAVDGYKVTVELESSVASLGADTAVTNTHISSITITIN